MYKSEESACDLARSQDSGTTPYGYGTKQRPVSGMTQLVQQSDSERITGLAATNEAMLRCCSAPAQCTKNPQLHAPGSRARLGMLAVLHAFLFLAVPFLVVQLTVCRHDVFVCGLVHEGHRVAARQVARIYEVLRGERRRTCVTAGHWKWHLVQAGRACRT